MLKSKPIKLLLLGLVLVAAGFIFLLDIAGPSQKTKAVISRIEVIDEPGAQEVDYKVYVDYAVDGTRYRDVPLGSYSAFMKEGKQITVRYNIENPAQVHTSSATIAVWVLFLSGGVCLFFSIGGLIFMRRAMKRS